LTRPGVSDKLAPAPFGRGWHYTIAGNKVNNKKHGKIRKKDVPLVDSFREKKV
jgi:hypothetical protein